MKWVDIPEVKSIVDGGWGAKDGKWQFVILYIDGVGYSASYKNATIIDGQPSHRLDNDGQFESFEDAEAACDAALKRLNGVS